MQIEPNPETVQELQVSWTFQSPYGAPDQPLLVAGDRLVGVYQNQVIYAVDLYSGTEIRTIGQVEPGGGFPYTCSGDTDPHVAVSGGRLFFVDNGALHGLRLSDGSPLVGWSAPTVAAAAGLAAFADVVLVASTSPTGATLVSAFNALDGRPAWPHTQPVANTISVGDGCTVGSIGVGADAIFMIAQGGLWAVNTRFGDVRFTAASGNAPGAASVFIDQTSPPLVARNCVVGCGDGVYAFDVKTGVQRWRVTDPQTRVAWSASLSSDGTRVAAVNSNGRVLLIDCDTGDRIYEASISQGGVPTIAGNLIYVLAPSMQQMHVLSVDDRSRRIDSRGLVSVGTDLGAVGPVVGNGMIVVPTSEGNISARPFASVPAAYFSGQSTVTIAADGGQFDFGAGDFTVEGWVHSSRGGEILSAFPTRQDVTACGFRFNLSADGELRFAVSNAEASDADLVKSLPTGAADGDWHHVAVVRRAGEFGLFVDGLSSSPASLQYRGNVGVYRNGRALNPDGTPIVDRLTPPPPPAPCSIGPELVLTIGANVSGPQAAAEDGFVGLVRELRVWDVAVDAQNLQSRMRKVLDPSVPHLKGNWHLADSALTNDVLGHEFRADATRVTYLATDLTLDDTAFPYHLEQRGLQWPYSVAWTVRGEDAITSTPAISDDGVVCFGTSGAVYGVNKSDGSRRWSIGLVGAASPPVAFGDAFYVFTQERGLILIDAQTGAFAEVDGFQHAQAPAATVALAAPATDGRLLAVATPDGSLWIKDSAAAGSPPATRFLTASGPTRLVAANGRVYCATGAGSANARLFVVDPGGGSTASTEISSEAFAVAGDRVFSVQQGQVSLSDASSIDRVTRSSQAIPGASVTGLAVDVDAAVIVVTTNQGLVYGLSCATLGQTWQTRIPDGNAATGRAAAGYVNPPAIERRDVFCTGRSGTVAAIDGRTGQLRGLFFEDTAVVTPPVVDRGTAYFGCDDAPPSALLDGGLHSVVFGQNYALRLGLDPLDRADAQTGYASIDRPDSQGALLFRDPTQMCVEAWVNTGSGGEILSLCPSAASGMGLGLSVDADGAVNFSVLWSDDGAWTVIHARAEQTRVADSRWHHIAVAHESGSLVRVYVDGVACTVAQQTSSATPNKIVPGLLACIGADASRTAPSNSFVGLIGEVRLWDTYLVASEIHDRMHDKLRGDEPDLLAYWNFDTLAVHDASRNGYDGGLAPDAGHATFWLTDLVFEHPSYPYFVTQARIVQVGDRGAAAEDATAETRYELTIGVRKADGSPLPEQNLECWYVRHADLHEPQTIQVATSTTGDRRTLNGIAPAAAELLAHESLVMVTDASGSATIQVITSDPEHGPSLDVRADFMPPNERYHLNVLLDNQKLSRPSPPTLIAQSKLIQDYHWSAGAVINADRSRRTYRTIVTAVNSDKSPRVGERIELWATDRLDVEVDGSVWSVGAYNSHAFYTDAEGELTLILAADALNMPRLSMWAGFMDRGARYVVDPAQDAQASLASLDQGRLGDDRRMTNWRSSAEGGPSRGSLLKEEYKPHASEIATAVRHVMALSQSGPAVAPPPPAGADGGDMRLGLSDVSRADFRDMLQPQATPRADVVRAVPTLHHIGRGRPVTPEHLRASLGQAVSGSLGFSIGFGDDATEFSLQHLATDADVAAAMGTPKPAQPDSDLLLGNFFGDIWDGVKHAANVIVAGVEAGIDEVKRIAVTIGEAVTVAIHTLDNVIHVVVNAVEDAVDVVVTFLKKIALDIWEVIQFLMLLFDWDAIVAAHRIIKSLILGCVDRAADAAADMDPHVNQLLASVDGLLGGGVPTASANSMTAHTAADMLAADGGGDHPAIASVHSVAGKMIQAKVKEHAEQARTTATLPSSLAALGQFRDASAVQRVLSDLIGVAPQLATSNIGDIGETLLSVLRKLATDVLSPALETTVRGVGVLLELVRAALRVLDATLDIPFLSALYRWITGDDLSIMDVVCLIAAVPIHIAYTAVTSRLFSEDARTLPDQVRPAQLLGGVFDEPLAQSTDPLPWGLDDSQTKEIVYVVFRSINVGSILLTDTLFAMGSKGKLRAFFKLVRGASGILSSTLAFVFGTPHYVNDLARRLGREFSVSNNVVAYATHAKIMYTAGLIGDLFPLGTGAIGLMSAPAADEEVSIGDVAEFVLLQVRAVVLIAVIGVDIKKMIVGPQYQDSAGREIWAPARYLAVNDMLLNVARLPAFVFTEVGRTMIKNNPYVYAAVIALRFASFTTALTLYSIAEFDFIKP